MSVAVKGAVKRTAVALAYWLPLLVGVADLRRQPEKLICIEIAAVHLRRQFLQTTPVIDQEWIPLGTVAVLAPHGVERHVLLRRTVGSINEVHRTTLRPRPAREEQLLVFVAQSQRLRRGQRHGHAALRGYCQLVRRKGPSVGVKGYDAFVGFPDGIERHVIRGRIRGSIGVLRFFRVLRRRPSRENQICVHVLQVELRLGEQRGRGVDGDALRGDARFQHSAIVGVKRDDVI